MSKLGSAAAIDKLLEIIDETKNNSVENLLPFFNLLLLHASAYLTKWLIESN